MKKYFLLSLILTTSLAFAAERQVIQLWPEGVPESNGITENETIKNERISNVTVPSMTVYSPSKEKNTGVAILVCPGGAYIMQAAGHEGAQFGEWLSENGITAFVLKYRLPNKHSFIPHKDASQAIKIIRENASQWGINPAKIGISGFSAGGHLAASAGTIFDEKTRPDFMILFYPVISMKQGVTHQGSRNNLLGEPAYEDSVNYYSLENQVSAKTPPTLLFLSDDDGAVVPQNSVDFYRQLKKFKVPASMYIFPEGGHGWGFKKEFRYFETWKKLYFDWLEQQKILVKN
jgi:acetyl esterase/lipase